MTDSGAHEELYSILGLSSTATHDDIVEAYKKEVRLYEEATKLGKKSRVFKEAEAKHKEVSKSFMVLSDASRRQQYDDSGAVTVPPRFTTRSSKQSKNYCVNQNEQSLTIFLPPNMSSSWLATCEEHYATRAIDRGKNGRHIKTSFIDAKSKEVVGSVSLTVYESTEKILVQGSAYLLWFLETFPSLKVKTGSVCTSDEVSILSQTSNPGDTMSTPTTDHGYPSTLCPTCEQPLQSDTCATCTTVPKVLLDCNSNDMTSNEDSPQLQEIMTAVTHIDCSIVQDNVYKLEACLAESITDRKTSEASILHRLSALENRMKTREQNHVCNGLSASEKEELVKDIARLENAKRELENQVKSLQRKYDELSSAITEARSASLRTPESKSMETQTTHDSSDRADKLLYELATVSVHNRFQPLDEENNKASEVYEASNRGAKRRVETPNSSVNQPPIQDKTERRHTVSATRQHQHNREMPPDVIILGDSNTKTIKPDVMYPGKRVIKAQTFNLPQATEYIQRSTMPDPKVLLFHVGTNDIRDARDSTTVSENFRQLIHTSHDKFPHTALVFSSVPPRRDTTLQEIGGEVNSFLRIVAEEHSFVHVTDNSGLSDVGSIKESLYNSDGYHLNRFGVRVLVSSMKKVVNPILGLGQYTNRGTSLQSPQGPGGTGRPPRFQPAHDQRQPPGSPRPGSSPPQGQGLHRSEPASSQHPAQVLTSSTPGAMQSPPMEHPATNRLHRTGFDGPSHTDPRNSPSPGQPQVQGQTQRSTSMLSPPPVMTRFMPNLRPGPWSGPPYFPPAPWSLPPMNNPVPSRPHRVAPPPWPWHPALMWPPMVW
ncbi:hypothetical protein Bbelb_268360 [Branchiostoma belcheri]|nr:hypothetical protein Bbelb_268360 [Branchiostoma belcheri]